MGGEVLHDFTDFALEELGDGRSVGFEAEVGGFILEGQALGDNRVLQKVDADDEAVPHRCPVEGHIPSRRAFLVVDFFQELALHEGIHRPRNGGDAQIEVFGDLGLVRGACMPQVVEHDRLVDPVLELGVYPLGYLDIVHFTILANLLLVYEDIFRLSNEISYSIFSM